MVRMVQGIRQGRNSSSMSTVEIILMVLIAVCAVVIGLTLRHFLVSRLKKTILDNWVVQTLGAIVFVIPLIVGVFMYFILLQNSLLIQLLYYLQYQLPLSTPLSPITNYAWRLFWTAFALFVGIAVGRTVMKLIIHGLNNNRIDINLRVLIGRITFFVIMIIDAFWIFLIWGLAIDFPVTVIGALTVTFTIAFQDILKDLVAGFYILMERPFHIGDSITIGNAAYTPLHTGVVENIELRATKLRISSGEQVTVPNSLVFGGIVINNSYYGERRTTINVSLPIEAFDKRETIDQILKALKETDTVAEVPAPTVIVSNYTGEHVVLLVHFWMRNEKFASISDVMYTLRTALPKADLSYVDSTVEIA
jgi:small conductance mechanosensitive channel